MKKPSKLARAKEPSHRRDGESSDSALAAGSAGVLEASEIRPLIDAWSSHGFFRVRRLGSKITMDEVFTHEAYAIDLRTQYEDRSVGSLSAPYKEGPVDDKGSAPGMWDIVVPAPKDFEDRTESLPVQHTERVQSCSKCDGKGKGECSNCHGSGSTKCPFCFGFGKQTCINCGGSGFRMVTQMVTTHNLGRGPGQPATSTRMESVRQKCTCSMGKVSCGSCGGKGTRTCTTCRGRKIIVCPACNGDGSVKTWNQLTVKFHSAAAMELVNPTDVARELIQASSGETVFDQRDERIEKLKGMDEKAKECAEKLLGKARETESKDSHLLFQQLIVRRIPVCEVPYRYKSSSRKRLWIYGNDRRIYGVGAPLAWKRIGIVIGSVVVLLIVAIALAVNRH